mgnify:FL=1
MPGAAGFVVLVLGVGLGATLNAAAGFGFSLLTVPLMALAVGPKEAVVLSAVMSVGSTGAVAWKGRSSVEAPVAYRLLGGALLGMPVGIVVLSRMAPEPLQILIALAVLASAGVLTLGIRLRRPNGSLDVGVGFVSGMFKTSVGVSGPPIVILLQGRGLAKNAFRATSSTVIVAVNLTSLVLFGVAGQIDRVVLIAAVVSLPALPVGFWLGNRLHERVPEERFRSLVLVMVVLSAGLALYGALLG